MFRGTWHRLVRIARGFALAGIAASLATFGFGSARAADGSAATAKHPMIGTDAPPFELETVAGNKLGLGDLRGKYLVIHFGASW